MEADNERTGSRLILEKSGEFEILLQHDDDRPLILGSLLGMLWGAVFAGEGEESRIYLIGPVLYAPLSDSQIQEAARQRIPDLSKRSEFKAVMESLPVLPLPTLQNFILMMHRCVTGEVIEPSVIQYQERRKETGKSRKTPARDRQQIYLAERQLLYHVREGDLNYRPALQRSASLSTGLGISTKDPVRRAILSVATFTSLCTRAAIEGGLSADTAYTVGDAYIQSMLACRNLAELSDLSHRMYEDFIHRVHRAREQSGASRTIHDCCEYIQMHPEDELSIRSLAKRFGYTDYYFSKKFKRETGESVTDYIDVVRMERAKMLLETTDTPVAEMADVFRFCSSTHFSNTFKRFTGMLPTEYRKQFR